MIFKKKLRNKNFGFTLTELLVVIFIISVLSSLSFVNYRSVKERLIIERAAQKLAQDIRRAQEMALAAKECPLGTTCAGQVPRGYGIYLRENQTSYILYADISSPYDRYGGGDATIEIISLENGIEISDITPFSMLSINFSPPDPKISINSTLGQPTNDATTTLSLGSIQKMIHFNTAGLIEVK